MNFDEIYIDDFQRGYFTCALWASLDEEGDPLDDWASFEDIDADTFAQMKADCEDFISLARHDLEVYHVGLPERPADHAGHDFWLTRNGHGAGFWDRYYGRDDELVATLSRLTDKSQAYGGFDLYVGDDGKVYGV